MVLVRSRRRGRQRDRRTRSRRNSWRRRSGIRTVPKSLVDRLEDKKNFKSALTRVHGPAHDSHEPTSDGDIPNKGPAGCCPRLPLPLSLPLSPLSLPSPPTHTSKQRIVVFYGDENINLDRPPSTVNLDRVLRNWPGRQFRPNLTFHQAINWKKLPNEYKDLVFWEHEKYPVVVYAAAGGEGRRS